MKVSHKVVLHFPPEVTDQPIIYLLARDYDVTFSILRATINPQEEGLMVLELSGEEANYRRAVEYLTSHHIHLQPLKKDITRNDTKCVECGACVSVCPTTALTLERPTMKVIFDADNCVACGECVPTCPVKAMELHF
jgi:ferredoxin